MKQDDIQYFAVVYCTAAYKNSIHLLPCKDKEDALKKLREMKDDPKVNKRIKATTIIKRDMSNFKDGLLFGCPKVFNVMSSSK